MLFDADVLIWVFRGRPAAARKVKQHPERYISVVTYMELMQGVRDKRESQTIKRWLSDMAFHRLPLTENIGTRASVYVEEYALSSAMDLADALVGATAVEYGLPLCTANAKHLKVIRDLTIEPFHANY